MADGRVELLKCECGVKPAEVQRNRGPADGDVPDVVPNVFHCVRIRIELWLRRHPWFLCTFEPIILLTMLRRIEIVDMSEAKRYGIRNVFEIGDETDFLQASIYLYCAFSSLL